MYHAKTPTPDNAIFAWALISRTHLIASTARPCSLPSFKHHALRPLWRFCHWCYSAPTNLAVHHAKHFSIFNSLLSRAGCRQGSPESSLLFAITIQPLLVRLHAKFPNIKIVAYLDDISLLGTDAAEVLAAYEFLSDEASTIDLQTQPRKCQFIYFNHDRHADALDGQSSLHQHRNTHHTVRSLVSWIAGHTHSSWRRRNFRQRSRHWRWRHTQYPNATHREHARRTACSHQESHDGAERAKQHVYVALVHGAETHVFAAHRAPICHEHDCSWFWCSRYSGCIRNPWVAHHQVRTRKHAWTLNSKHLFVQVVSAWRACPP